MDQLRKEAIKEWLQDNMGYMVLVFMVLFGIIFIPATFGQTTYKQEGNKIVTVSSRKTTENNEVKTSYVYVDSKGKEYEVFKSVRGAYYVKKVSAKTGKEYKYYLPKDATANLK